MLKASLASRRRRCVPGVLLSLALAAMPVSPARGADAAPVVAGLQAWLDGTRDLQGRFVQRLVSGALGEGLEERGRFWLKRPGRMRWDYTDPEVKVAVVQGQRTLLYLEEDRQLWEGSLDDGNSLLPLLMSRGQPVNELFDGELLESETGGDRDYRLRLVPRGSEEGFEQIVLDLRAPGFAIREVEVLDAAGNRMVYTFSKLKRNAGVGDQVLHFEAPPGTEVVRP